MEFVWNLKEYDYKKYQKRQYNGVEKEGSGNGDYIGNVRCGNLCFDIFDWGSHLWFDLYVGGVDSGYGYSNKEEFINYPYDYADSCSFKWDKNIFGVSLEEFKHELSIYIEKHIMDVKEYISDMKAIKVNLIVKANDDLQLW